MDTANIETSRIIEVLEGLIETIITMDPLHSDTQEIKVAFKQKAFCLDYKDRVNMREGIIAIAQNKSGKTKMQAYELAAGLYNNQVEYSVS